MELGGYVGSILYINLTTSQSSEEPLDPELAIKYVGGWGINHKLYYDHIPPRIEPLSPDNPLIIGTGPFPGTTIPGSSRTYITYKHPLSGTIGSAPGSGVFSCMLKSAGYDHVVIIGRARKPTYLKISEYGVELCDAGALWGRDTYETVFALRNEYEPCSVIAIGPAGENLVNISVTHVDSGQGALGQGGMPAVMGSKNLKALVVIQGTRPVTVAYPDRLKKVINRVLERVATYPRLSGLREGGGWYMLRGGMGGTALVMHNKGEAENEANAFERHKRSRRNIACACCPVACRERIDLLDGEYAGLTFYHSLTAGASLNMLGFKLSYDQLVKYNDTMNRYGVDRMFFSNTLQVLFDLYEDGSLSKQDIGDLELERGFNFIMNLATMVAYRQGFGDTIADGIISVCKKLSLDPERDVIHIKGWNRVGDPRIAGMSTGFDGFSQLVDPRGPTGSPGSTSPPSYQPREPIERWIRYAHEQGLPKEAEGRIFGENEFNVARLAKWMHSYFSVLQNLGFCGRLYITRFHDLASMTEYYSALTGVELAPNELLRSGERNWNMLKILNTREGFSRGDDRPPNAWFKPLRIKDAQMESRLLDYYGRTELYKQDIEELLDDYYDESGWYKDTTAPTSEKLSELDLVDTTL
ncbi:aldehyde ferredoxin oxidoreductase N-terminal domain-containing protein [Chloroflexota bacterium]